MSNLYNDCKDMLTASILVYGFAKLRQLAREGKLTEVDTQRVMSLPLSAEEVGNVVIENRASLQRSKQKRDEAEWILSVLDRAPNHDEETGSPSKLMVFADNFKDSDLVYGISVNQVRQRITIAFRGSVTTKDFLTDASTHLKKIPNPLEDTMHNTKSVGIHTGFYSYMFQDQDKGPQFHQLMHHIDELRKHNPGFCLFFTGHSLGGALATFVTFCVAASLPNEQITCYTFGSPKVGNLSFRRAFQALERHGRIRCLRVANAGDSVTMMPDFPGFVLRIPDCSGFSCLFSWLYILCCQRRLYRHVGMHLKLKPRNRYRLSPAPKKASKLCVFCRDFWRKTIRAAYSWLTLPFALLMCCTMASSCRDPWGCNLVSHHVPGEYMDNLEGVKAKLEQKTLEELYEKRRPKKPKSAGS